MESFREDARERKVRTGCPFVGLSFFVFFWLLPLLILRKTSSWWSSGCTREQYLPRHTGERAVSETRPVPVRLSSICKVGDASEGCPENFKLVFLFVVLLLLSYLEALKHRCLSLSCGGFLARD